ncbi:MAG: YCF48-related protein [Candidatus Eremiobacterota bacterium]
MKKYSILLIISILSIMLIAGCGGGGSTGVIPNNGSVTTIDPTATPGTLVEVPGNPTTTPGSTIPSNLPTGTFKVEVQFPGAGSGLRAKDLTGSDLPYNSHTLRVTITGEAIATSIVGERNDLDPTGAGTYTLTVSNIPVGLNTATIEVLDPSGNLLCQRKHGFYMTPGATEGPGLILLGVAIQSDGSYVPQNIDIPAGSSISFQNHDYTNDRTASMNSGAVTVGPIGHAAHITQPVTAEVFPAVNNLFNTQGQFDYDGQTGRVLVYGLPTLTSVSPEGDSTNGTTSVGFTLTGTNFGTSQSSVNGAVNFIQVNENDPNNPWGTVYNPSSFTSWSNTSIVGTINLPAGKYRIEVSVRGENTTETVFFYKGTGNYQVIVGDDPNATPPTLLTYWTKKSSGTHDDLISVRFADVNNGWVTGKNGTVLKTTDGGTTWRPVNIGTTDGLAVCYAKGNDVIINKTNGQTIYKSNDGGNNWTTITTGIETVSSGIGFTFGDANTGWFLRNFIYLGKTTDGGASWSSFSTGSAYRYGIYAYDSSNCWLMCDGGVYSTTDGTTWSQKLSSNYTCGCFTSATEGFVAGWNKKLNYTNDGGTNWQTVNNTLGSTDAIFGLMSVDGNYLWIQNSTAQIHRSADRGTTWTHIGTGFTAWYLIDSTHGWAVWNDGCLYKYQP